MVLSLPSGWEVDDLGPSNIVDDFEVQGEDSERKLVITLRKETLGQLQLDLRLVQSLAVTSEPIILDLPLPTAENLNRLKGFYSIFQKRSARSQVSFASSSLCLCAMPFALTAKHLLFLIQVSVLPWLTSTALWIHPLQLGPLFS